MTGTSIRVLRPDFEKKTWNVVSNWGTPKAAGGEGTKTAEAAPAAPAEGAEEGEAVAAQ